jgi:hypothetical protein
VFRKKLGNAETKIFLGRAVYLINIGSNDYGIPFTNYTNSSLLQSISQQEFVDMVIGNLTTVIKVRKISIIQSIFFICFLFPLGYTWAYLDVLGNIQRRSKEIRVSEPAAIGLFTIPEITKSRKYRVML